MKDFTEDISTSSIGSAQYQLTSNITFILSVFKNKPLDAFAKRKI